MLRPLRKKASRKIKRALKPLLYLTLAFALVLQVVSSAFFTTPGVSAGPPSDIIEAENKTPDRDPWERPEVAESQIPQIAAPSQLALPSIAPTNNKTVALPPPPPFPFGNNNLGRAYKDSNNPEDHPGRHFAGPVNLINGNFYLTTGDHFFVGAGLSVQFARSYNSLAPIIPSALPDVIGNGWTHSYDTAVIQDAGLQVFIRNGDGSIHEYSFNGASWDPPVGIFRELQHNPGDPTSPYRLRHKSGVIENFAPQASTTPGRLQKIEDRNGNATELQYTGGLLTAVVDPATGHHLEIAYDTSNRIEQIIDPIGRETRYFYDLASNLERVAYPEGTDATYSYDGLNRLIRYDDPRQSRGTKQVSTIGYDGVAIDDPVTLVNYGAGVGFAMTYNAPLIPPIPGADSTVWQDALGRTNRIIYDVGGPTFNIMEDGTFFSSCGCFQGQNYQYNGNNLLQIKADALGNTTQYAYDSLGNMLFVQSPLGIPMAFEYDMVFSVPLTSTNVAGDQITYAYDANGNLIQEDHPLGRTIKYSYDSFGNLITQTDPEGKTTEYEYDLQGNLLVLTDTASFVTKFDYDPIGRVDKKTDPLSNETTYTYDALDRLIRVTDPIGGNTDYEYDLRSNLVVLTDTNGFSVTHTYDGLDRLLSITDTLGSSTGYVYDVGNQLVLRTDANGNSTTYVYDEVGRMLQRTSGLLIEKFEFDPAGRLTGMADGTFTTTLDYDANSNVVEREIVHPDFSSPTKVNYTYDALDNRETATLDDGTTIWTTTYDYDVLSRLVKTTDQNGREWTTTYNLNDQRLTQTLPDNSHVEYDYDANDNVVRVEHFDPANVSERKYEYTYDPLRNILTEDDDGVAYSNVYDALSRSSSSVTPFGNVTFGYDAVGNRTSVTGPEGLNTFVYDDANHLLNSNDTTYAYDLMGARTKDQGPAGTRQYAYDREMRLQTVDLVDEPFQLQLTYDPLGELVRKQDSDGNTTFFLQGDGRLEAELDPQGDLERVLTVDTEIVAMDLVSAGPIAVDFHRDGRNRVRWVTDSAGDLITEYSGDPTEDDAHFYNPIRLEGMYFFPEIGFYYLGDGQFWDPVTGLLLFRYWPWVFWPFNPYHPLVPLFRYWPWAWPWATPWGFPWPTPWPFLWPWPGVWIRPFLIWPMWPWPSMPFLPWWWWNHWWGWWSWGHWWWWHPWRWWNNWWYWGWSYWGWWGWHWWIWHWWWPWWWWQPCWWIGGWWWWHWHWRWWSWWWWRWWWWWPPPPPPPPPPLPRPPDYGDARDPLYPSLLASNGARHLNPALEWLGPAVDREFNAKVIDLDLFDDGVTIDLIANTVTFTATTTGSEVRYTASTPLHVHGWIDWGDDGTWHPGDLVLDWSGYPGDGTWPLGDDSVSVTVSFVPPATPWPTMMWSRFRLDYAQDLASPTGAARYGEVEDYKLTVPLAVSPTLAISNPSGTIAQLDCTS